MFQTVNLWNEKKNFLLSQTHKLFSRMLNGDFYIVSECNDDFVATLEVNNAQRVLV